MSDSKKPFKISVEFEVKDKLCLDLLTTAVEGGSAYWLACRSYTRDTDLNVTKIVGCFDREDASTQFDDVDIDTMRSGIERILSGKVAVREDVRGTVLAAVLDDDNSNWDSETADLVLQAGLHNEIVYG